MRLRLGALLLVLVVEGCAATATSDGRPVRAVGDDDIVASTVIDNPYDTIASSIR